MLAYVEALVDTIQVCLLSNPDHLSWWEILSGGQFDWSGRLLKGNGGDSKVPSEWLEITS